MNSYCLKLVFYSLVLSTKTFAQTESRQITINVGATHNFMRFVHKMPFSSNVNNFNFIPGGNISLDWSLWSKLSFGASVSGQHHTLFVEGYQYTTVTGNKATEDVTLKTFISGLQSRILIHPTDVCFTDELDFYFGVQESYMIYFSSNNSSDPDFYRPYPVFETITCAVVGFRYFPRIHIFGFYAEVAFPGPYTVSAGICIRNFPKSLNFFR